MSSSFVCGESDLSRTQFYSRKEKSLGLLCTNFLLVYNRDGVHSIGLDDAAAKLGVERRRIYDVVNILESVGVVARKQKNQYLWKGFEAIPQALEELKKEGLKENFCASGSCSSSKVANENESEGSSSAKADGQDNSSASSKAENKREKSLWLLAQNFVKLFVSSDVDLITLDNAAMQLLDQSHNSTAMRTKVRRLYDIANVLSSLNLIEKTHHPDSRKPAFRWLGWRGNSNSKSVTASNVKEPKKRMFGTLLTNHIQKRSKLESSTDWKSNQNEKTPGLIKCTNSQNDGDENNSEHPRDNSSKNFVYGPFTPVSSPAVDDSGNRKARQILDFESLASTYYPQYHNQALDDLFRHYKEAWQSWYVEFAGKETKQI